MNFGEFLRMKRKAKKMSIRQLALYAGCSDSYLSLLERGISGQRGPTPAFLRKLVKPLGVPYEVLMAAAGFYLQTEDESLYTGAMVMMLRDSMGDDVDHFARRAGMSPHEISTLEEHGVSYDTMQEIYQTIFGRQKSFSSSQKELICRIESTFLHLSTKSSHLEKLLHSVLDFVHEEN